VKGRLGLDRPELEDQDEDSDDELEESMSDAGGRVRGGTRKGVLGDWEKIGWMAAGLLRRVPGIEFMWVSCPPQAFRADDIRSHALGMVP